MREVLSRAYADDVIFLDFVMFPYDRIGEKLPIFTWPTTIDNRVYNDFTCPLSQVPTERFDYYDEDIEDYVEIAWHLRDCAARWTMRAWAAAGGKLYRLPCFFTQHDGIQSFSFRREQWIRNFPEIKQNTYFQGPSATEGPSKKTSSGE